MIRATLLIVILITCITSFTNCQVKKNTTTHSEKREDNLTAGRKKHLLSGKVTITYSYCGGAAPTEEMLRELAKPQPYVGKVFYVRKGNRNMLSSAIVMRFTTDSAGSFSVELPSGTWSLIQEEQVKEIDTNKYQNTASQRVDMDCLKKWWSEPYEIIEIKDSAITDLHFSFHRRCFINSDIPCFNYTGPYPP